jgi:hypothetical protein
MNTVNAILFPVTVSLISKEYRMLLIFLDGVKRKIASKMKIPVWALILAVIVAAAGTALAFNVTVVTKKMSIYGEGFISTDFTVTSVDTFPKGQNKVTVNLVVHNGGSAAATCIATVQLLNSTGEVIKISGEDQELVHTFSDVPAGTDSSSYTYTFTATGLVAQYVSTYMIFTQN